MNDELTPEERAALRARIVGGARGITPVGAHRGAWIAGSIAAVLVVAIAGGVVATSTLSAPPQIATTPSPMPTVVPTPRTSPSPTAVPTTAPAPAPGPVRAFDGDCASVLTDEEVAAYVSGDVANVGRTPSLASDVSDVLELLGGVECKWTSDQGALTVVVADAGAVDAEFARAVESVSCTPPDGCAVARISGDLWIGVVLSVLPGSDEGGQYTSEQKSEAGALMDSVITRVAAKDGTAPVATIGAGLRGGWALDDCAALLPRLEDATGEGLTMDDPDGRVAVRTGLVPRLLATSAGVTSCTYLDRAAGSRGFITVDLLPGVPAPDTDLLDTPGTFGTSVEGADAAWGQVAYDHVYVVDLIATVGENRLALRRMTSAPAVTDAERIAATVVAFLDGRG